MRFTYDRLLLIATIYLSCSAATCRKYDIVGYHFTENINLYPEQEIYHIGDTIWIEHQNPTHMVYDKSYNLYFLADTFSIPFYFLCETVYNLPPDTTNTFCNFIVNGVNVGPNYNKKVFGCNSQDSFNFKIGMVLNKTGTFSIGFPVGGMEVVACNFISTTPGQQIRVFSMSYRFTYIDGHKDIFLGVTPARRSFDKEWVDEALKNKIIYFFKVE